MAKLTQPLAPADRLLTAPEVAERLRLATHSVYALARRDELPPKEPPHNGPEGLLQAGIDWFEGFDEMVMTGEEYIDAGRGQVIARVNQAAHGEHSGVPVEADFWFVWTLHNAPVPLRGRKAAPGQAVHEQGRRPQSRRAVGVGRSLHASRTAAPSWRICSTRATRS
jgi:hypothetical protein